MRLGIRKTLSAIICRWNHLTPVVRSELLKLGFDVAQSSVAKYMAKQRGLLRNHASDIAVIYMFVIPTIGFNLLYAPVSRSAPTGTPVVARASRFLADRDVPH
jgi:hypothetical protein